MQKKTQRIFLGLALTVSPMRCALCDPHSEVDALVEYHNDLPVLPPVSSTM